MLRLGVDASIGWHRGAIDKGLRLLKRIEARLINGERESRGLASPPVLGDNVGDDKV